MGPVAEPDPSRPPMATEEPSDGYQRPESTPSRLADNLYWLGRYLERTAQMMGLLDHLSPLLRNAIATLDPTVATDSMRMLLTRQQGWADADMTIAEMASASGPRQTIRTKTGALPRTSPT